MRKGVLSYIAALLFLCSISVNAQMVQKYPTRAGIDSIMNPSLHRGKVLLFEKTTVDMGTLHESDTVRVVTFPFRNVCDTAVTITRVTTHCGCTAAEFNRKVKLRKSRQLLEQGGHTVSEVAQLTGFNNLGNFRQAFKKEFGMPPSASNKAKEGES